LAKQCNLAQDTTTLQASHARYIRCSDRQDDMIC